MLAKLTAHLANSSRLLQAQNGKPTNRIAPAAPRRVVATLITALGVFCGACQSGQLRPGVALTERQRQAEHQCQAGGSAACTELGKFLVEHAVTVEDTHQGLVLLEVSCGQKDDEACTELGLLYNDHPGIERSPKRSRQFLEPACSRQSGRACTELGVVVIKSGAGGSAELAAKYFRRACQLGDAVGCDDLGVTQLEDEVSGNRSEAAFAFDKACALKFLRACHHLAQVKLRDDTQREVAIQLLESNCTEGFTMSCAQLAGLYAPLVSPKPHCDRLLSFADLGCLAKNDESCAMADACRMQQAPIATLDRLQAACSRRSPLSCLYWADAQERKIAALAEPERLIAAYRVACSSHSIASMLACVRLATKDLLRSKDPTAVERSLEFLKNACADGSGEACCRIGDHFNVDKNPGGEPQKAEAYRTRACQLGYTGCCTTSQ